MDSRFQVPNRFQLRGKGIGTIGFDAGVLSYLEYLEATLWAEDEEEKVASLLSKLQLEGIGGEKVLKRVSLDVTFGVEDKSDNEEVLLKLLQVILEGKDEKAMREMKVLETKMLCENSLHNDLRKESLPVIIWAGQLESFN
ncbi:BTB/POZ domain-containing protein [Forsythia ovata]|uniref:BTB/POZ domain-containing protein n=1 Tax=Forsythia ovata TaxID=205694 RepID=A0ABD1X1R8_9LAMI